MASKVVVRGYAKAAELQAIVWASEIAVGRGWKNAVWSSDAAEVIKEISANQDPCGW